MLDPLNMSFTIQPIRYFCLPWKQQKKTDNPIESPLLKATKIVTRTTRSDAELAQKQTAEIRPVALMNKALQDWVEIAAEQLELGSAKLL